MTYGAGSITFERGRYRLRVPDGKGGHRSAGVYDTRELAERMRDALTLERGDVPLGSVVLYEYGERVIERWARAGMRSVKAARSRWSSIVQRAPFALLPIVTLGRVEVRDWVRELGAGSLSWQTVKHALTLLRRVLDEAREDGLIADNVARAVKLPRRTERAEGWTWLTTAELAAVLALPLTLEQRTAITLAVYQGLRQGELAALRWADVDLMGGWLLVAGSWTSATKSGRVRRIPLLRPAREALELWRAPAKRRGLVLPAAGGACYSRGYDWGWGDRRDGREDVPTRAGLTRRVRWHDLRHTCGAHLVSGSWGRAWLLAEVRDYLGHSSVTVTERYAHLAPGALHATAAATAQPAADLPQDVSAAAVQVLNFVRRAMRDSNARPMAPEAAGNRMNASGSVDVRQVRGMSLLEHAAAGDVTQAELDALAAAVLAEPSAIAALEALAGGRGALAAGLRIAELANRQLAQNRILTGNA